MQKSCGQGGTCWKTMHCAHFNAFMGPPKQLSLKQTVVSKKFVCLCVTHLGNGVLQGTYLDPWLLVYFYLNGIWKPILLFYWIYVNYIAWNNIRFAGLQLDLPIILNFTYLWQVSHIFFTFHIVYPIVLVDCAFLSKNKMHYEKPQIHTHTHPYTSTPTNTHSHTHKHTNKLSKI